MMSLSDDMQAYIIDAYSTMSRYLNDILNMNNIYFGNMVNQIYHMTVLQWITSCDKYCYYHELHTCNTFDRSK